MRHCLTWELLADGNKHQERYTNRSGVDPHEDGVKGVDVCGLPRTKRGVLDPNRDRREEVEESETRVHRGRPTPSLIEKSRK